MAKRTSEEISSLAGRGLRKPDTLTPKEIRRICASALSQDETAKKLEAERVKAALVFAELEKLLWRDGDKPSPAQAS